MVNIGRFNELTIVKELPRGFELDGGKAKTICHRRHGHW